MKESTIGTAQDVNGRGFSAYFPEGVVEILDSTVNGHMSISGGDVTIKGGTFNATGFGGQTYIYNEQETIEHLEKNVIPTSQLNNGMISTGEPVFIIDRRSDSYNLKRVTIEGVAFNTKIDLSGVEEVVHAIKYVDLNSKSSAARSVSKPAQIILKNNTYNHLPKETGPNMFIRRPESIGTHPNEIQEYTSIFVTEKGDSVEAGANRTVVSQNSTVTIESGSVTLNDSDKSIVKKTKLSPAILADEAVFHKIAEILGNSFVANPQDNIKIVATPELSVKPLSSGTDEYKVEISGKAKISAYKVATSTVNNETGNLGNCIVSHEVPLKTFTTQVILSIGVPASKINNNINVYVDHIGDEHDNYVGSSHLVKVDNSNTVTIPVNHFSIFTVSQASYPEIRSYAEEEATTSNLITRNPNADGITEIQVDPSKEVTFSVPTGINVSLEGEKVTKESVNIMPDRTVTFKLNDLTKKTLKVTAKFEDSSKIGESVYIFKAKSSGGGGGGAATPPASGGGVTKGVDLLRLYNPNSGEHFYTSDMDEKNALVGHGWIYEGTGWTAPEGVTNTPVYRLYNPNAGDHHYTKSSNERDTLVRIGWKDEGIGWYSDDKEGTPLFRLYNPNEKVGNHHYTTSEGERDYLTSIGWKDEGIGWYGVK